MTNVDGSNARAGVEAVARGTGTTGALEVHVPRTPRSSRAGRLVGLRGLMPEPFSRNSYALIANTGLTAVLGLAFWGVVPRLYGDSDVGRGSALISAMTLISGVVAINVSGTLSRFIPACGRAVTRIVLMAYGLSSVVIVGLVAAFLATLDWWGPAYDLLRDPTIAAWFIVAVVAAGIFTVQDGVLVGLRNSMWVPVENVSFGIAKIALLVALVSLPREGVYLSWIIPMIALLVPVNLLIFARLIPRHVALTSPYAELPRIQEIGRFLAADYVGALFMFASATLVPFLVAPFVEPYSFAYFFVAWVAAGAVNLIATNVATSLTVEGVYDVGKLVSNCRTALRRVVALMVTAAVVIGLVAPYGLTVLGRGYADAASMLQALALAAVPRGVIEVWIGVLRARSRIREIARVQIASGGLAVAAVVVWLYGRPLLGEPQIELITGVGLAVLVSQVVVAVGVLPGLLNFLRLERPEPPPPPPTPTQAPVPAPPRSATAEVRGGTEPASRGTFARVADVGAPWGLCLLSVIAAVFVVDGLTGVSRAALNGYGLISILPVTTLVGLALLTLSFVATLSLHRQHRTVLGVQVLFTVVSLHGAAALSSTLPRFPVTWIHIGLMEYVSRNGTIAGELDGRFSWPGFFTLSAFWLAHLSWQELLPVLNWVPVISNVAYLLPIWLLLSSLRMSWQARWLAAWLACVLNWVGQDYFSPQGFAFWLYLMFIALMAAWLRPSAPEVSRSGAGRGPARRAATAEGRRRLVSLDLFGALGRVRSVWAGLESGEVGSADVSVRLRAVALFMVIGVFAVAAASHPLTPFLMLAVCTGLVLTRRCVVTGLPLLLAVILAGWTSYMAVAYWGGHLSELLGGLGDISGNISSSVLERTSGSFGDQHRQVVALRIALAAGVLLLAVVGALRRMRRGVDDRLLLVLLSAPGVVLALQSYGGEIALRVYLFALPAAAVLVAYSLFPEVGSSPRRPGRFLVLGGASLVLVGGFLVARYGNEKYEQTEDGTLAAMEYIYGQRGPLLIASVTFSPTSDVPPFLPIGYRDIERVTSSAIYAPPDPTDVSGVVAELRALGPRAYLVTSASTDANLEIGAGYRPGWGRVFRENLARAPELRMEFANDDAAVFTSRDAEGARPAPPPVATGTRIGHTAWTSIGLVFFGVLLPMITSRECFRLRCLRLRSALLTFVIVVVSIGFSLVVVERFILLS